MKHMLAKLATLVLVGTAALLAGPAGPAAAAVDYGTFPYISGGRVIGSAHIWQVSGNTYEIAVADTVGDGGNICVAITPTGVRDDILYCDMTGPGKTPGPGDGKASHYRISYSWYIASVCHGQANCRTYVTWG